MPSKFRCRYYSGKGSPIGGGCRKGDRCDFLHPQEGPNPWRTTKKKSNRRCKYFDSFGYRIGPGCWRSSEDCPFYHPDDSGWPSAKPPLEPRREEDYSPSSYDLPPSATLINTASKAPLNAPTGPSILKVIALASSPPILSSTTSTKPTQQSPKPIPSEEDQTKSDSNALPDDMMPVDSPTTRATDLGLPLNRPSKLVIQTGKIQKFVKSTTNSPIPNTEGNDNGLGYWRKRISTLQRVIAMKRSLQELDFRLTAERDMINRLYSDPDACKMTLGTFESSAQERRQPLEKELKNRMDELEKLDFWGFRINVPPATLEERGDVSSAAIREQLNVLENRLAEYQRRIIEREQASKDEDVEMAGDDNSPRMVEAQSKGLTPEEISLELQKLESSVSSVREEIDLRIDELNEMKDVVDTHFEDRENVGKALDVISVQLRYLREQLATLSYAEHVGGEASPDEASVPMRLATMKKETETLVDSMAKLNSQQESLLKSQRETEEQTRELVKEIEVLRKQLGQAPSSRIYHDMVLNGVLADVNERIQTSADHYSGYIESQFGQLRKQILQAIEDPILKPAKVITDITRLLTPSS